MSRRIKNASLARVFACLASLALRQQFVYLVVSLPLALDFIKDLNALLEVTMLSPRFSAATSLKYASSQHSEASSLRTKCELGLTPFHRRQFFVPSRLRCRSPTLRHYLPFTVTPVCALTAALACLGGTPIDLSLRYICFVLVIATPSLLRRDHSAGVIVSFTMRKY